MKDIPALHDQTQDCDGMIIISIKNTHLIFPCNAHIYIGSDFSGFDISQKSDFFQTTGCGFSCPVHDFQQLGPVKKAGMFL